MKKISDININYNNAQQFDEPTPYRCEKCGDSGIVIGEDNVGRLCECAIERRTKSLLSQSRLPVLLRNKTFDNFELRHYSQSRIDENGTTYYKLAEAALRAAKQFVKDVGSDDCLQNLIFVGTVGTGKTHLASAVANRLIADGKKVVFLVVPEFLEELRATYNDDVDTTESRIMQQVQNADVLILDDLGAHNFTEWTRNKIFSIVNYRSNHGLPCVITTNHSPGELASLLGARTVSRLMENCNVLQLKAENDIRFIRSMEK